MKWNTRLINLSYGSGLGYWAFKELLIWSQFRNWYWPQGVLIGIKPKSKCKTMHSRLTRWVNRLLLSNFKIKHIPRIETGFRDLLSRLPTRKTVPTSYCDNEFVVATLNKILENFTVSSICTKKNCKKNELLVKNPVDVNYVNSVTNLDYVNPIDGKKELVQHIQLSFIANVFNYVTNTERICNSNYSRSESCTSGCIPLNYAKIIFNQLFLSEKTYFFFISFFIRKRVNSKSTSQKYKNRSYFVSKNRAQELP